ncbi:hypothetical protein BDZ89DRAFT_1115376 [Hymenopellis radicata]|nr:hypothetical protein BDZ89DRAFT_1115376 [Hymenopellis radicata]
MATTRSETSRLKAAAIGGSVDAIKEIASCVSEGTIKLFDAIPVVQRGLAISNMISIDTPAWRDEPAIVGALAACDILSSGMHRHIRTYGLRRMPTVITRPLKVLFPTVNQWMAYFAERTGLASTETPTQRRDEDLVLLIDDLVRIFGNLRPQLPEFVSLDYPSSEAFFGTMVRLWVGSTVGGLETTYLITFLINSPTVNHSPDTAAYIEHPTIMAFITHSTDPLCAAITALCIRLTSEREINITLVHSLFACMVYSTATAVHINNMVIEGILPFLVRLLRRLISLNTAIAYPAMPESLQVESTGAVKSALLMGFKNIIIIIKQGPAFIVKCLEAGLMEAILAISLRHSEDAEFRDAIVPALGQHGVLDEVVELLDFMKTYLFYRCIAHLYRQKMNTRNSRRMHEKLSPECPIGQCLEGIHNNELRKANMFNREFVDAAFSRCANVGCSVTSGNGSPLRRCINCRHTAYCSQSCQRQDWNGRHKEYCSFFSGEREISRMYNDVLPTMDQEFVLWIASRDIHRPEFRPTIAAFAEEKTMNDQRILVLDYADGDLEGASLASSTCQDCVAYWPEASIFDLGTRYTMDHEHLVRAAQALTVLGELPVLILTPMGRHDSSKRLTTVDRLVKRRYAS